MKTLNICISEKQSWSLFFIIISFCYFLPRSFRHFLAFWPLNCRTKMMQRKVSRDLTTYWWQTSVWWIAQKESALGLSPTHAHGRLRLVTFYFCLFYQTGTKSIRLKLELKEESFQNELWALGQTYFFFTYQFVINFNSWLDEWNMRLDGSTCSAEITCCLIVAIGLIRQKFCIWTCLLYYSMAGIITEVYKLSKERPNPLVKLTKVSG